MMKINKLGKTVSAALFMSALLAILVGCQKPEGPVERAGKSVDKTVEKVGDSIHDATKGNKK